LHRSQFLFTLTAEYTGTCDLQSSSSLTQAESRNHIFQGYPIGPRDGPLTWSCNFIISRYRARVSGLFIYLALAARICSLSRWRYSGSVHSLSLRLISWLALYRFLFSDAAAESDLAWLIEKRRGVAGTVMIGLYTLRMDIMVRG